MENGDVIEFVAKYTKLSKTVTYFTSYVDGAGTELKDDSAIGTLTLYSGGEDQTASYVSAAIDHYNFDGVFVDGSAATTVTVGYDDVENGDVIEFVAKYTPNSLTVPVRFNYIYNGTVITYDEKPVTITYGESGKTVTSTISAPAGYYLLGSVPTVTVTYAMALEMGEENVYEVDVLLGIIADDDDVTPQIPLGPGTAQTAIPLGIGIPSTGNSTGISILLMAMGLAVVAIVAIKAKRSSTK